LKAGLTNLRVLLIQAFPTTRVVRIVAFRSQRAETEDERMDRYSKFIQTLIAIALVWLSVRPFITAPLADAQAIANVRIVAFDLNAPLPVINGGPPFPVRVVDTAAPLAVTLTGPLPLPVVKR
jgi:hypothetical protein